MTQKHTGRWMSQGSASVVPWNKLLSSYFNLCVDATGVVCHELGFLGTDLHAVVSRGSTSFSCLVFFFGALLLGLEAISGKRERARRFSLNERGRAIVSQTNTGTVAKTIPAKRLEGGVARIYGLS